MGMATTDMTGQVAIVTGGGRGLGRAHCLALSSLGASVIVNDLVPERAEAVVSEIENAGGRAIGSVESIGTPEGCRAIVQQALDAYGTVDAVVNNAGIMRNAMFEDQSPRILDEVLAVHILGPFFLTQAAWGTMSAKGYGRVVMVSSSSGLFSMQGNANYAAAKGGVYGLMKALAFEGRAHGIAVNALLPHAATDISENDPVPNFRDHQKAGIGEAMLERRIVEAVAPMVAWLCSPACSVSGEAFAAGCGRFARVFVGVAQGWVAPDAGTITADDVDAHLAQIRDLDGYEIPRDLYEEIEMMARAIGWATTP
jgi:NAD(P)-dependent dehydrogenase (short-subunit alcohol dehydrogenase family)